jgi:hypothetical protein
MLAKDTHHRLFDIAGHVIRRARGIHHGEPVRALASHRQESLADLFMVLAGLQFDAVSLALLLAPGEPGLDV